MARIPTAPVVVSGIVGGYLVARETEVRPLGGAVLGACGAVATVVWWRGVGPAKTAVLLGTYLAAFGASHPLAKKVGPWPAVLGVAATSGTAAYLLADRARRG
jgi:hypothetical protein